MRKQCETCGATNRYVSPRRSYACSTCGSLIDWRQRIECRNCGYVNHLTKNEIDDSNCNNCYKPIRWTTKPETYTPNTIPLKSRLKAALGTILLVALSGYGILNQHLTLPYRGKSGHGYVVEFNGYETILPILSLVLGAIGLILFIADHYDKRNNEYKYKSAVYYFSSTGWLIYLVSFFFGKIVR